LFASKPDYYSHSEPQGVEGGHYEEVGLGLAKTRLIAFYIHFFEIVRHGYLFLMGGVLYRGFQRKGARVLGYNIIVVPKLR
jgi:hypothetical protein